MGKRPIGKSIDRKNNDGNYNKRNCRWATPSEQALNSRQSIAKRKHIAALLDKAVDAEERLAILMANPRRQTWHSPT
jgi:hypothetical protein